MKNSANIMIGTSGWVYASWRGKYYPDKLAHQDELSYYSTEFCTVEINNSFYKLPPSEKFANWAKQVPENFVFAVKASRYLSHNKKLKDAEDPLQKICDTAKGLGRKLGPMLLQLPPNWERNLERLEQFLNLATSYAGFQWVLEFRHESWFCEEVYRILEAHNVALCIADSNKLKRVDRLTADFAYIRYHGRSPSSAPNYTQTQLRIEAQKILRFAEEVKEIYVYFNNDAEARAVYNAQKLEHLIRKSAPEVRAHAERLPVTR